MASKALPEHIGPYRVTGRLGHGGMGEVLQGHDDRLDRRVALKRIRPGGADPDKARRRFQREARVAARLSHQAIVQVYDWVAAGEHDWLVMERVEGRSLGAVLADGPLPSGRAINIASQIASGLAAAHDAGLVHRDLKPGNVMVIAAGDRPPRTPSGRIHSDRAKILDFGIARTVESGSDARGTDDPRMTLTEAGQVVGTVTAMSPEQALGYPVDHRSDLFSLGSLLYEMLSGVSPYAGASPVETLSRICSACEMPLKERDPQIPESLSDFVGRLLQKQPERRPADAHEVAIALEQLAVEACAVEMKPASDCQVAGLDDETLAMPGRGEARVSSSPATIDSGEGSSDTNTMRRASSRWAVTTACLALVVVGLVSWSARRGRPAAQTPTANHSGSVLEHPLPSLTSHELFQRGMEALERYDKKANIEKAIADFQRALTLDEGAALAYAGLARAYWLDSRNASQDSVRLEHALAAAQKAVELDPFLSVARVNFGLVLVELGRPDEAIEELEQAQRLEPLNADAWFGLARVAETQGDVSLAEQRYRRAIELRPDWTFQSQLGEMYSRSGRYHEAEVAFLQSLELAPENYLGLRNLGAVYYLQGNLDEAASQFQSALRVRSEPSVYANLGSIYFAQALYADSVAAFEKAIESGGSNFYVMWGNLGDAYRWTPDNEAPAREAYERAIQILGEKLVATPESTTLRTRLALYSAKLGNCGPVTAVTGLLAKLADEDLMACFRLVVANEVCGRRDDALAALELALFGGFSLAEVRADPELLDLRKDVRYHRLVMKLDARG